MSNPGAPRNSTPDRRGTNLANQGYALTMLCLLAGFTCLTSRMEAAISVGPAPTGTGTNTFDSAPAATEWATATIAGAAGDLTNAATLDAYVIANTSAASITTALAIDATDIPPTNAAFATARYFTNATDRFLQTCPTGVKYNVLMATLRNDSGGSLAALNVSYDLGNQMTPGRTVAEEVPGHQVYYSQTGAAGSWTLAAGLSGGTTGTVKGILSLGGWAPGALLYILWVDDNAAAGRSTSGSGTSEGCYTIDNWVAVGIKKDLVFQQGLDGYTGAVDTEIRGGSTVSDTEFSTVPILNPDGSDQGGEVHSLLRFEGLFGTGPGQVPPGKTILKATLTLNISDLGDLVNMHRMNKAWAATNTWNQFDPVSFDGVLSGSYSARTADDTEAVFTPDASFDAAVVGLFDIDIPVATIQAWADGTATNYGWAFVPTGTDGVDFSSSDNATVSLRPKLSITWGEAGGAVVQGITSTPKGFKIQVQNGSGPGAINTNTIVVKLDNVDVTAACVVTQASGTFTVTYSAPTFFASGSAHLANITFSDVSTPPKQQSTDLPFQVVTYATIPAEYALTLADIATNKPGFRWRVHQNALLTANNNQRPLDQLEGKLIDPNTSQPYANEADPTFQGVALEPAIPAGPAWLPLRFAITNVINMSQTAGENNRYFPNDEAMPGIPFDLNGIAGELVTYLELPAGLVNMGVSSDDGSFTTAANPWAIPQGVMLGEHISSGEIFFTFLVNQAGIYAIHTVWEEATGGANIEWFSIKDDGTKVLINDTANGGLRGYRETLSPYIESLNPRPGAVGVPFSTTIDVALADGSASKVQTNSIKLWLNGVSVTPTISRPPGTNITTVTFDPPGDLVPEGIYTVRVEFGDDAISPRLRTVEYSFTAAFTTTKLFAIDDIMQWSYHNDGTDQGTAWRASGFADNAWPQGPALLALESGATVEPIRTPLIRDANADGTADIITDYFRGRFTLANLPFGGRLLLRYVVDDGAIFYINGVEVHRFGTAATTTVNASTLFTDHEGRDHYDGPVLIVATNLVVGTNVMAVEVHQSSVTSSDVVLGVELASVTSVPIPAKFINVRREAGSLRIEWIGSGTLQQAGAVTGPWTTAPNQSNPQFVPTTGAAAFYRLKQ